MNTLSEPQSETTARPGRLEQGEIPLGLPTALPHTCAGEPGTDSQVAPTQSKLVHPLWLKSWGT